MLTAANLLSLSRIAAAPFLYALIVAGGRDGLILAAALFALASLTDTLDGRLARRRRMVTPLGVYLDTTADKILVAVLLVALAVARQAGLRVMLDVDLPELEDMPTKLAAVPARGLKLSVKEMSATFPARV